MASALAIAEGMLSLLLFLACTSKADESGGSEDPTVSFLAPEDGATVGSAVEVSVVVENFVLSDAGLHNDEGETASGFITFAWDDGGAQITESTASTQATLSINSTGEHSITATLFYDDGDAVEPEASATVTVTVSPGG